MKKINKKLKKKKNISAAYTHLFPEFHLTKSIRTFIGQCKDILEPVSIPPLI